MQLKNTVFYCCINHSKFLLQKTTASSHHFDEDELPQPGLWELGVKVAKLTRAATRWLKPLPQGSFIKIFQLLSSKWDFDQLNTHIKLYHLNYPKLLRLKPL